jgi:DNA ligase-1
LRPAITDGLHGQTLLDSPFSHRRHLLRTLFPALQPSNPLLARFDHVESLDSSACTDVQAEMQAFFEQVVEQKCEGLMVKLLESGEGIAGEDDGEEGPEGEGKLEGKKAKRGAGNVAANGNAGGKRKPLPATYEPDQRSQGWLKVKKGEKHPHGRESHRSVLIHPDYLEGLGDSLDLVPIGAWWGQGRKAGWWSPILLACHNPETGALEAVCKCELWLRIPAPKVTWIITLTCAGISGFTDAFYKDLIARYPPENAIPEKCNKDQPLGYYDTNGLRPDVWFEPSEVWEIRGAE